MIDYGRGKAPVTWRFPRSSGLSPNRRDDRIRTCDPLTPSHVRQASDLHKHSSNRYYESLRAVAARCAALWLMARLQIRSRNPNIPAVVTADSQEISATPSPSLKRPPLARRAQARAFHQAALRAHESIDAERARRENQRRNGRHPSVPCEDVGGGPEPDS
jgi:hypothetical protein